MLTNFSKAKKGFFYVIESRYGDRFDFVNLRIKQDSSDSKICHHGIIQAI